MASTSIQLNYMNRIRCDYCQGAGGLILIENVFKLKNLGSGMEYCLHSHNQQYLVGRALGAHIPIAKNTGVSRRHAYVWVSDDAKLYIKATEASNGTYINGIKLIPNNVKRIKVHDIISFGFPCKYARCVTHAALRHGVFTVKRQPWPVSYKYQFYALQSLPSTSQ